MCGITGIVGQHAGSTFPDLLQSLCHRGPDDNGSYYDRNVLFIHTRLAIIDLSSLGHQPMTSEDGNYVIIYNGEIYNHLSLRKVLSVKYQFKSSSDTETLLYGFIEYGKKVLDQLNGIFSFAIYNKKERRLFIARDPSGVKPLYYYQYEGVFVFASEIKSIASLPFLNKGISCHSLLDHLVFLYCPGRNTVFENVKKLLPGHYIELSTERQEGIEQVPFYQVQYSNNYSSKTEKELTYDLEQCLLQAIERQMVSDVPLGFFLSGGIDSSLLLAMARSIYPQRTLPCFTITSPHTTYEGFQNDIQYARIMAEFLKVELFEIPAGVSVFSDFDKAIYQLDEPLADPAAFHVLDIAIEARKQGCKVLISGTGADELFSGYRRHQALYYEHVLRFLPKISLLVIQQLLSMAAQNTAARRLQKIIHSIGEGTKDRHLSYYTWLPATTAKNLFAKDLRHKLSDYDHYNYFKSLQDDMPEDIEALNKMLYWDFKTYLPDNNLNYTDKMSMSQGIEVRVPFLDRELIRFSSQLPTSLKMKGATTKYLLRKVSQKYLPEKIIKRPKTGFGAPVRSWIRKEFDSQIQTYLHPRCIESRGIFDPKAVWELIEENRRGKTDASYSILALLAIESWIRQFVDSK